MPKYALFGCRVKNGARELQGGWADCLTTADTIEELKSGFREERESQVLITFSEELGKHEEKLIGYLTVHGDTANKFDWYKQVEQIPLLFQQYLPCSQQKSAIGKKPNC
jgi:hypothetical protein